MVINIVRESPPTPDLGSPPTPTSTLVNKSTDRSRRDKPITISPTVAYSYNNDGSHLSPTIGLRGTNPPTVVGDEDQQENPYTLPNGLPSPVTQACQFYHLSKSINGNGEIVSQWPRHYPQYYMPPGQLQLCAINRGYLASYDALGRLEVDAKAESFFDAAYGSTSRPKVGSPWGREGFFAGVKANSSVTQSNIHIDSSSPAYVPDCYQQSKYGDDGFVPFGDFPFGAIGEGRTASSKKAILEDNRYPTLSDLVADSLPDSEP